VQVRAHAAFISGPSRPCGQLLVESTKRRIELRSPTLSLAGRRFPEFHFVSFRIDDPSKLSVLGLVNLLEHIAAFFSQGFDQRVEILYAVIDHERGSAGRELVALGRTNRPGGSAANGLAFIVGPSERCAAPSLDIDSEMAFVPSL
jgi:hypothetical protein